MRRSQCKVTLIEKIENKEYQIMNIYSLRFVCNKDNSILEVEQFGNSEKEIKDYWTKYFSKGKSIDAFTYIDCTLKVSNVKCQYDLDDNLNDQCNNGKSLDDCIKENASIHIVGNSKSVDGKRSVPIVVTDDGEAPDIEEQWAKDEAYMEEQYQKQIEREIKACSNEIHYA